MVQAFHMTAEPFLRPLLGSTDLVQRQLARRDRAAAEHQAEREKMQQSLVQPRVAKPAAPVIKTPVLADDHEQQVANLDERIVKRGIAIDSETLSAIGKQRFDQLLVVARQSGLYSSRGAALDLSRFQSVQSALGAYLAPSVPARKTREQIAESGREKDEVRRIADWRDLWKFSSQEPHFVRAAYEFHDHFASLVLGQSMLEKSSDGRLRSRWLCGGRGAKVARFTDWLSRVARDSLTSVKLVEPLWHLVAWLAGEKAPPAAAADLAKDWFNVRSPTKEQLQTVSAVVDGFLFDLDGWHLWQHVGRQTRSAQEQARLSAWRLQLAKRFVRIAGFHTELRSTFVREIDMGDAAPRQQQFELAAYRRFVDRTIDQLLQRAGALLALGVDELVSATVVARFECAALVECKRTIEDKRATISRQLLAAFPASSFELEFAEVRA